MTFTGLGFLRLVWGLFFFVVVVALYFLVKLFRGGKILGSVRTESSSGGNLFNEHRYSTGGLVKCAASGC